MKQNTEMHASECFTEEDIYIAQMLVDLSNSKPSPHNLVSNRKRKLKTPLQHDGAATEFYDEFSFPHKKLSSKKKKKCNDLMVESTNALTKSKASLNELNNSSTNECKNPTLKLRVKMSNLANCSINPSNNKDDNEKQEHLQKEMQMDNTQHIRKLFRPDLVVLKCVHTSEGTRKRRSIRTSVTPLHEGFLYY